MKFRLTQNIETNKSILRYGQLPLLIFTNIYQYDLQKKSKKFKWTEEAKKAFNDIKELLISPPVLKAHTPHGLFCLESDTS